MPLYAYRCKACGNEFEEVHKIVDRNIPVEAPCSKCGETQVSQILFAPKVSYSNPGSMKTTDAFNDRLKEIKNKVPERFKAALNDNIR
jgi:putative FmdB family regulatory protein